MIEYIVLVFLVFSNSTMQIVGENKVKTEQACLEQVIQINSDKDSQHNAACFIRSTGPKI
tara:strand:- start:812 stop:991 length:180 start_codon:yes stop_codon:yes gene_type:complete